MKQKDSKDKPIFVSLLKSTLMCICYELQIVALFEATTLTLLHFVSNSVFDPNIFRLYLSADISTDVCNRIIFEYVVSSITGMCPVL